MSCVVCGKDCGPLRGEAKSWKCAGLLAHETRQSRGKRAELRSRFSNPGKQQSRQFLEPDILALREGATVLDLYGGGLSAEWIKGLRPDLNLIVAERDRALWPALRRDAASLGFIAVHGDFSLAAKHGPFDLIWLDLCGDPFTAFEAVRTAVPMLASRPLMRQWGWFDFMTAWRAADERVPSALYVTVMEQNRRGFAALRPEVRDIAVRALLDEAGGCLALAEKLHEYPQAGGKGQASIWAVGASLVPQVEAMRRAQAERERDAEVGHHAWVREDWNRIESGARELHWLTTSTHTRGACRCVTKGLITAPERDAERTRYEDAKRASWSVAA